MCHVNRPDFYVLSPAWFVGLLVCRRFWLAAAQDGRGLARSLASREGLSQRGEVFPFDAKRDPNEVNTVSLQGLNHTVTS